MKITEIAYTCYAVNDIKKARAFYEGVLGLKSSSVWEGEGMAFVEYQIGPHYLAVGMGAPAFTPGASGGVVAFEVADFPAAIEKLKSAAAKFVMEAHDTGACHMAVVEDPAGNRIMIHKRKPQPLV